MSTQQSTAEVLADAFVRHGVRRIFGVPGGGSSLDVIRACEARAVPYILARTEAGAAIMASVTADLTGTIGVAVTTQGPGTASAANGVAYASLEQSPLVLITDGWTPSQAAFDTHQVFDQKALLAPLAKGHTRLDGDAAAEVADILALAKAAPPGPVHIELTGEAARRLVRAERGSGRSSEEPSSVDERALAAARDRIRGAKKPLLLIGLEARQGELAPRIAALAEELGCPVLTTYKAKGVVAEDRSYAVGLFTGGALEKEVVHAADLIVLIGFDPVELIGRPWLYRAPVLDLGPVRHPVHYVERELGVYGPLAATLDGLRNAGHRSSWSPDEIAGHKAAMRKGLRLPVPGEGLSPEQVVEEAQRIAKASCEPRVAADAGAHMFSAMGFWECRHPGDVLISNGLATMAFALPAAIAAALHEPERPVVAFIGDGGLMMCAGELATAAQHGAKVCAIVFNDGALSLIAIKQKARQLPSEGVTWPRADFAAVAAGLGVRGFRARNLVEYRDALESAFRHDGPTLIDVWVDPSGYPDQAMALRG